MLEILHKHKIFELSNKLVTITIIKSFLTKTEKLHNIYLIQNV